ncbi:MAG: hypothetical protein J5I59_00110 [Saprospiraceae bacterium]|nr:hypothetical protein [Saprospiraceae bacterium]
MKKFILLLAFASLFIGCDKEIQSVGESANSSGNGKSGSTASMITYGDYMYFIDNSILRTMSLTDPAHPVQTSQVNIPGIAETLFAFEDALYVGTRTGVLVYDLTNKAQPVYQDNAFHWPAHDPVVVQGNYGYSTTRWGDQEGSGGGNLTVLDVSNRLNPITLYSIPQEYPYGLGISGEYLYVCNGSFGINIFKINQFNSQVDFVSNIKTDAVYDCIPSEELLICQMSTGIGIFNISTPDKPVLISKISN